MNRKTSILTGILLGAALATAPDARADKDHDHSKHDHSGHDHGAAAAVPLGEGMATLQKHVGEMEKELAVGSLEGIHGHDEAIQSAVKDLDKDTTLTADRKKRVQGYVKNVRKLSGKLHAAADGKKLDQARKDLEKLRAQVDLLAKQFTQAPKPGAAHPAHEAGKPHAHPTK